MRPPSALFLALTPALVAASAGDRSPEFQKCVSLCETSRYLTTNTPPSLPLALRLTQWTSTDNCKYQCMHEITTNRIASGQAVLQYYGKWPFWRLFGMQEPASVAFSLLNLLYHTRGLRKIRREIFDGHPMKSYYIVWSLTSMNAWVWSSVFHIRDTPRTEKLDYFSAATTILFALYFTTVRLFHLYLPPNQTRLTRASSPESRLPLRAWTILCLLTIVAHISYLSLLPRFDYTYNIIFNLGLGLIHNLLWTLYSLPSSISVFKRFPYQPRSYRPSFVTKAGVLVVFTTAATGLELFDFPAWGRIIDAHSLWHLATAPLAIFWYRFLIEDAHDPSWRETKILS